MAVNARPVRWIGRCPNCETDSPEMRDTEAEAEQDALECECQNQPEEDDGE